MPVKVAAKFIIVLMMTDHLMDILGSEQFLSVNVNLMVTVTEAVRVNEP